MFFHFIAELDGEQRRLGDATKNLRKCERGIKELTFRQDEDRKNNERMQELVDKLQQQVRTYKRYLSFSSKWYFVTKIVLTYCEKKLF